MIARGASHFLSYEKYLDIIFVVILPNSDLGFYEDSLSLEVINIIAKNAKK